VVAPVGLGALWQEAALDLVRTFGPGLTDVLNAKNDKQCRDHKIEELRELSRSIDEVVLRAYGWGDLSPTYGFFDSFFGVRFMMDPLSLSEVYDRLLKLNHERAEEIPAAGRKVFKKSRRPRSTNHADGVGREETPTLFSAPMRTPL
jgi:hypothetical protein